MTWMIIRLVLSLAFVAAVLFFAARLAQKRGLGQGNGLIEVVARQRMGRASTVNVIRVADLVLVVGATEEQVTVLAEVDPLALEEALAERRPPARLHAAPADGAPAAGSAVGSSVGSSVGSAVGTSVGTAVGTARPAPAALAGSVFDRAGWAGFMNALRERTVRR